MAQKTLQDVCDRCSRFSGWNLTVQVTPGYVSFKDEGENGSQSWLTLTLYPDCEMSIREIYGRMRHWGIDLEERIIIADAILASMGKPAFTSKFLPMDPLRLDE